MKNLQARVDRIENAVLDDKRQLVFGIKHFSNKEDQTIECDRIWSEYLKEHPEDKNCKSVFVTYWGKEVSPGFLCSYLPISI